MASILLIDDDKLFLKALADSLNRDADMTIDTSTTAEQGLRLISQTDYDVIFSDMSMPGLNGLDLLKECAVLRPQTPVILITGYGSRHLEADALCQGAVAVIEKPVTAEVILGAITVSLHRAKMLRRGLCGEINTPEAQGEYLARERRRLELKIQELNERLQNTIDIEKPKPQG